MLEKLISDSNPVKVGTIVIAGMIRIGIPQILIAYNGK